MCHPNGLNDDLAVQGDRHPFLHVPTLSKSMMECTP